MFPGDHEPFVPVDRLPRDEDIIDALLDLLVVHAPQALGLMQEVEVECSFNLEMTSAESDYNTAIVADIERAFRRAGASRS